MSVLDGATLVMGIVTVLGGLTIAASAFVMPPQAHRTRRLLRLFKAALFFYIGCWWIAFGLAVPHSAEVSRHWLRPAVFLVFVTVSLSVHYETVAPWIYSHLHSRSAP